MKKHTTLLLLALFSISIIAQPFRKVTNASTPGVLTITATESTSGGGYSPKHITAIWIQDSNGNFIKTLLAFAATRKTHLNNWESATTTYGSPYNTVDAISGATKTSYATRTCSWDGTDLSNPKTVVPDGSYTVKMELTDKNNTGNLATFTFTKGPNSVVLTPANQPSFSNVTINWSPSNAIVTGVTLMPVQVSVPVNKTTILTHMVFPADARDKSVIWESGNKDIATVSSTGVVSGVSEGKTTISVTTVDQSKTASSEVTVLPASTISNTIYTGRSWKSDGWIFGEDNESNFSAINVIEAWQYDMGACMPLPTDFTNAIGVFKAGDFAAGQIKAVTTYDATCAAPGSRMFYNDGNLVGLINRPAYLNIRKAEFSDRFSTSCPTINSGSETLDINDPAMYANPSVVTMNDAYGRLSNSGAALRYSIHFDPGKYNFLYKGNAAQAVDIRILKRGADNTLTEVYAGTASATGATQMNAKVSPIDNTQTYTAAVGYEKLLDHMKIYATGACVFSLMNNTNTGKLLELDLNGDYVLEMISNGTNGAAGAYTFKYAGDYTGMKKIYHQKTSAIYANHAIKLNLNGQNACNVKLYSVSGILIANKYVSDVENSILTYNLSKGTYFVRFENAEISETHRVIVN